MHALRTLRSHGMDTELLQTVYRAVIIAKLLYASIVPGGALQQHLIDSAWTLLMRRAQFALDYIQLTNQHLHNSPKTLTTHCFVQSSTPSIMFYTVSYLSLNELTTHTILDLGLIILNLVR